MISIEAVPALSDNYIYLAATDGAATLVDPGEAAPALDALRGRALESILITHRHADHVGGVGEILQHHPDAAVYAPAGCDIAAQRLTVVEDGGDVDLLGGALVMRVLATPGHTLEHVSYYGGGALFCGDTLFACGCGRVFEGTMAQMHESLSRLLALPGSTQAYCGHEYTAANIRFALAVNPGNADLQSRARAVNSLLARGEPTVPFTIDDEKAANPFARLSDPAVRAAAKARGADPENESSVFAALRRWKDEF